MKPGAMTPRLRSPRHLVGLAAVALVAAVSAIALHGHATVPSGQGPTAARRVSSAILPATAVNETVAGSMTTEPGGPPMSTGSIDLQSRPASPGLAQIGTDDFQLVPNPSAGSRPQLTFTWAYSDGGRPVTGPCAVTAEVTGPANYDQQQHSTECIGSPASGFDITAPGLYGISVEVTPPGGGSPAAATRTVTVRG
jgi:hypothetical protein